MSRRAIRGIMPRSGKQAGDILEVIPLVGVERDRAASRSEADRAPLVLHRRCLEVHRTYGLPPHHYLCRTALQLKVSYPHKVPANLPI